MYYNNKIKIKFPEYLQTIFIILKLTKLISWSWWWVLSPFWISALIVLVTFIIITIIQIIEN